MTLKTLARIGLFATLGLGALSAFAGTGVPVQRYHYGQQLDVQKVLAVHEDNARGCGVTTAQMDYLDSHGQPRSVQYQTYTTNGCHEGG
ncbi:DUF2790 domain-containing protein [Pseudomonas sp. GD03860]|uniref:DUF2790 domain-containing protein n=1 Tax=Pseudomonas TaxID=286 RepID=UPI002363C606|nr:MULTISPECIES: DUF2790 domain-containing protein [Pseudomonas]MDD2056674.1 DUF2790 domain-containing protein [Pseudomonas putida]MDH0638132.1 DUF2790 domain-containing protein [Pseudomonas sp. GD03860]